MKPTVGRIVHYRSYGTPGGEYAPQCRAAVVTGVCDPDTYVSLAVLNPEGMFFSQQVRYDSTAAIGGRWHWPEREDSDG